MSNLLKNWTEQVQLNKSKYFSRKKFIFTACNIIYFVFYYYWMCISFFMQYLRTKVPVSESIWSVLTKNWLPVARTHSNCIHTNTKSHTYIHTAEWALTSMCADIPHIYNYVIMQINIHTFYWSQGLLLYPPDTKQQNS